MTKVVSVELTSRCKSENKNAREGIVASRVVKPRNIWWVMFLRGVSPAKLPGSAEADRAAHIGHVVLGIDLVGKLRLELPRGSDDHVILVIEVAQRLMQFLMHVGAHDHIGQGLLACHRQHKDVARKRSRRVAERVNLLPDVWPVVRDVEIDAADRATQMVGGVVPVDLACAQFAAQGVIVFARCASVRGSAAQSEDVGAQTHHGLKNLDHRLDHQLLVSRPDLRRAVVIVVDHVGHEDGHDRNLLGLAALPKIIPVIEHLLLQGIEFDLGSVVEMKATRTQAHCRSTVGVTNPHDLYRPF